MRGWGLHRLQARGSRGDTCQGSSVAAETSQRAPDALGLSVSPLTDAQGPGVAVALSWCPCSLDGCPPRPNPYGALGDIRMALPLRLHLGTIWPFPVLTSLCPGWCPSIFSNDNDEGEDNNSKKGHVAFAESDPATCPVLSITNILFHPMCLVLL